MQVMRNIFKKQTEQELRTQAQEGVQAERLLQDETFETLLSTLIQKNFSEWQNTSIQDAPTREKLFLKGQVINELRQELKKMVERGKASSQTLNKNTT